MHHFLKVVFYRLLETPIAWLRSSLLSVDGASFGMSFSESCRSEAAGEYSIPAVAARLQSASGFYPERSASSIRILLVSVEAPPSFNPEAFQVGRFLEALRAEPDLVLDIATADPRHDSIGHLTTLLNKQPYFAPSQVVAIPCKLKRWQRALIRSLAPWVPNRPDWSFLFAWRWRQVVQQLLNPPDLIYSRSFPLSSTLAAFRLAKYYNVPWFLHLSDPWSESSIESEGHGSRWHRRQDLLCLEAAQRISFTSLTTLERYQQRYPHLRERMVIDPNCYTQANLSFAPWQAQHRFRIVHTGSLTLGRWPDPVFQALTSLLPDHPLLGDLEFIHAGPVDKHTRRLFDKAGEWFHDKGLVSPSVALELQRSADLLLVVDYSFKSPLDAQYLPSKLTDYLPIRRPVLAITDVNSASWCFIIENRLGTSVAHDDQDGLVAALLEYWQAWRRHESTRFELQEPSFNYSAHFIARCIVSAARKQLNLV